MTNIKNRKRDRVKGSGPNRRKLKVVHRYNFTVPDEVCNAIVNISKTGKNDLGGDNYKISQHCDLTNTFQEKDQYRQILLQTQVEDDMLSEMSYTKWNDDPDSQIIKAFLDQHFKQTYRSRVATTPKGHTLDWHIDTDTSVMCRHQIIATENDGALMEFEYFKEYSSHQFKKGDLYFINTGWPHAVSNKSDSDRIVLIFDTPYENIYDAKPLLKVN